MANLGVARRPKAPDEARGLRSERARERMRFIEHEEVETRIGEELDVLLPGEEQLELLDVGEQDPRLPPGRAHDLPGTDLFGRIDRFPAPVAPRPCEAGFVVGP